MSPRKVTVSDNDILEATAKAVAELGPTRLTLADVARRVGLAAPTLVQRFGSKRGLLLALASMGTKSMTAEFQALQAQATSALDAIMRLLLCFPTSIDSPDVLSNHLAFLQIDLNDSDFRVHAADNARGYRHELTALIERAIERGELRPCDPDSLARSLGALAGGSMLAWAIEREGALVDWVRRDLETVLARFRPD